jgi:hypothetical protein
VHFQHSDVDQQALFRWLVSLLNPDRLSRRSNANTLQEPAHVLMRVVAADTHWRTHRDSVFPATGGFASDAWRPIVMDEDSGKHCHGEDVEWHDLASSRSRLPAFEAPRERSRG